MLEVEQMIEVTEEADGKRMVGLTDIERQSGRETFDFYCFLIWPFIEAAWLGAVSLISLTPPLNVDPDISISYAKSQDAAQLVSSCSPFPPFQISFAHYGLSSTRRNPY